MALDVLYDYLGFAVLGDNQRFLLFGKISHDFSSMGLQVADGPNLP